MKILLIRPKPDPRTIGLQHVMVVEPLELLYVGAVLEEAHNVVFYDMILESLTLKEVLEKEQPEMVIMSGYIAHVGVIKRYAHIIKTTSVLTHKPLVVVGGVHAEVLPEDFLDEAIDYIIASNGLHFITQIVNGQLKPGIIKEKKVFETHQPMPARHLIKRYEKHYYYMFHRPCHLIKTSFGCPYACSFCFCKEITEGQYVQRDLNDVLDELQTLPHEEVYIVDDDFLFDEKRLLAFVAGVKERGIHKKYLVYGRADFIAQHPQVMKQLKAVGLSAVIVGLETFSESELEAYNKKSHIGTSVQAINLLKALDIECYGTFIIGLDWGKKDFKALYQFIKNHGLQFINLQPLTPMPGTPMFDQYKTKLVVPREDYHMWDMAHAVMKPTQMSIRQFYFEIVKLYYKITVSPKNSLRALKRYPLKENIVLSIGANRVMLQYMIRILKGQH